MFKFVFFVLLLFFYFDLCAYIDPGSGSFLIQLLVAFFAGGLFFAKNFFKKIRNIIGRKNKSEE